MRCTIRNVVASLAALIAVSLAASGVRADTSFQATLTGYSLGAGHTEINVYDPSQPSTWGGASPVISATSNQGGEFHWTQDPANPTPLLAPGTAVSGGTQFISYCIQINQQVSGGLYTYDPGLNDLSTDPQPYTIGGVNFQQMGTLNANLIAQLWYNHQAVADGGIATGLNAAGASQLGEAAFQLAVWKLAYERSATPADHLNLSAGSVQATLTGANPDELNLAQTWLNELVLTGNGAAAPRANLQGMSDMFGGSETPLQDQVVAVSGAPIGAAPEPASVLAWTVMGLLGFVIHRRSRPAHS